MDDIPEIEKIRIFHDLHTQYDVPATITEALKSQLSSTDQSRIERFVSGFKIEDWFEWTFSAIPWIQLIHGLDQQQFPTQSKKSYQVPDFLLLVETSSLAHLPLLVEVKRVAREKISLKLPKSQLTLCEQYAGALNIPLVYAVYWETFNAWTLNTPDTFECKSSSCKLTLLSALQNDCGGILGDISFFVSSALTRISRFTNQNVTEDSVRHEKYGRVLSSVVSLNGRRVEMSHVESAAVDSMLTMATVDEKKLVKGEIELTEILTDNHAVKFSSWITRFLAKFNTQPSEKHAAVSAHVIAELMEKLDCPKMHVFPSGKSSQINSLDLLFRTVEKKPA